MGDDDGESTPDEAKPPRRFRRLGRFIRDHRLYYAGVLLAMLAAGFLGFGLSMRWGAQQWGSFADWIVGGLTLSAVVVALREAIRAQVEREIDLELERRRECIRTVADYWAVVTKMRALSLELAIFFRTHDFGQFEDRQKLDDQRYKYSVAVQDMYIPQRFYSGLILHETPLLAEFDAVHSKVNEIVGLSSRLFEEARAGGNPSGDRIAGIWREISQDRSRHLELARKVFTLDRRSVRAQLRRRRT